MPLPPRPILAKARPGRAVPRKSLPSQTSLIQDSRAEMAFLGDFAKSVPVGQGGVQMVSKAAMGKVQQEKKREEVTLEELITEGKGGREKRSTTATTLGFHLIPNPTVLTLPERPQPKASLLTAGRCSPALSTTPATPSLLATRPADVEDDADADWEHISSEEEDEYDSADEEDVIVLGEMELEDELDKVDLKNDRRRDKAGAVPKQSYADVLGERKKRAVAS